MTFKVIAKKFSSVNCKGTLRNPDHFCILKNNYKVNAHYHRSLKRINNLSKNYKNLNKLKLNLADSSIVKKFLKKKIFSNNDIFINLVGFTDNISFEKFDEKNLINNLKVNYINPTMIMKDCLKNMLDLN